MAVSLGFVVEASGVVNGDHVALLGEVLAVAGLEESPGHTHLFWIRNGSREERVAEEVRAGGKDGMSFPGSCGRR